MTRKHRVGRARSDQLRGVDKNASLEYGHACLLEAFADGSYGAYVVAMYRVLVSFAVVISSWYLMMGFHEVGHVLHAWASGGEISQLTFPVFGFSATEMATNPRPLFVAWGGPVWGCLLPVGLLGIVQLLKTKYVKPFQYLAGFCFIANGAYLGVGSFWAAGDAGDLLRHGAHQAWLIAFGVLMIVLGLLMWHRLGPRFGFRVKALQDQSRIPMA